MNVNGVTGAVTGYTGYSSIERTDNSVKEEAGAVYEKGSASKADRRAIVAQLKADMQSRLDNMQSLVTRMFEQQGIKIGTADDMWKTLAGGKFTADADTIAKAKADIAEDGYWGVSQTSQRMFDFARALAGDDTEKLRKMQEAFEKGFKEAAKTWGSALPDISSKTYEATNKLFEEYYASH